MKTGISSYAYTWSLGIGGFDYQPVMNAPALITKTAELNQNLLQIADNLPLHTFDKDNLIQLRELASDLHVELEMGAKGLTEKCLEDYLDLSGFFGSRLLRFVIDNPSENYLPSVQSVADLVKNALPELRKRNIRLAIENHDRFRSEEFVWLMNRISDEQVGICLDCANSIGAGESIFKTVELLAPYTINLHLKDIQITRKSHMMGFDINGVPFGMGIVPLEKILSKMPTGCRTAILELWMPPADNWADTFEKEDQWVRDSLSYLKSLNINHDKN